MRCCGTVAASPTLLLVVLAWRLGFSDVCPARLDVLRDTYSLLRIDSVFSINAALLVLVVYLVHLTIACLFLFR